VDDVVDLKGVSKALFELQKRVNNRRKIDTSIVLPSINVKEKTIHLPNTFEDESDPNLIVKGMLALASYCGFTIYKIDYAQRKLRDIGNVLEKEAAGISFAILDIETHFSMSVKKDEYEQGRTLARAQQIIGLFNSSDKLGIPALKKNHRFFGNNPQEMEKLGKKKIQVEYISKDLSLYFREEEWARQLSQVLTTLLRFSGNYLSEEVKLKAIQSNIISKSEIVSRYGTRSITVESGRKNVLTKVEKVPHKPRKSPLLSIEEQRFINELIDPLFSDDIPDKTEDFVKYVLQHGYGKVVHKVAELSGKRAKFCTNFSNLTTKRLGEVRVSSNLSESARKKDVDLTRLQSFLSNRTDHASKLASEITALDPKGELFIGELPWVIKNEAGQINKPATWKKIIELITEKGVYSNVNKLTPEDKPEEEDNTPQIKLCMAQDEFDDYITKINNLKPGLNFSQILDNLYSNGTKKVLFDQVYLDVSNGVDVDVIKQYLEKANAF
jgi:hypothetical protein